MRNALIKVKSNALDSLGSPLSSKDKLLNKEGLAITQGGTEDELLRSSSEESGQEVATAEELPLLKTVTTTPRISTLTRLLFPKSTIPNSQDDIPGKLDTDGSIAYPSPRKGHPTYAGKGIPPYAGQGIPTYARKGLITYAGKGLMSSGTLPNESDKEGNTFDFIRVLIPRNGKVNPSTPEISKNPKRYGYY
ncbi:hypothetical protein BKA67DRAFT_697108 [Truncatella angustata]|uniref:Uncharacterized protein n=1 Tax=Truncatella angustata TaxID=152316 RepID=A0A9P8UB26_9PEZI|nr:uncharacterized protein BKA67DRAFT_697108 [Truncatella angustata]KAH6643485.1 hypothetical protein BKA67DRAFT_697108 [Truncatella angustata]